MQIRTLNLWILRFAQYDKDFVRMTNITGKITNSTQAYISRLADDLPPLCDDGSKGNRPLQERLPTIPTSLYFKACGRLGKPRIYTRLANERLICLVLNPLPCHQHRFFRFWHLNLCKNTSLQETSFY